MKPTNTDAILSLVGGQITGHSDGTILYHSGQKPPTEEEIETELKRLEKEHSDNQYQRDRLYPEIGEQLDMLFHDMTAGKGDKTGEWYKAISKVKSDHPKP